ncbi:MAG: hypothetical protein Tsb005_00980 [Gammaproteobacteria bacterium]
MAFSQKINQSLLKIYRLVNKEKTDFVDIQSSESAQLPLKQRQKYIELYHAQIRPAFKNALKNKGGVDVVLNELSQAIKQQLAKAIADAYMHAPSRLEPEFKAKHQETIQSVADKKAEEALKNFNNRRACDGGPIGICHTALRLLLDSNGLALGYTNHFLPDNQGKPITYPYYDGETNKSVDFRELLAIYYLSTQMETEKFTIAQAYENDFSKDETGKKQAQQAALIALIIIMAGIRRSNNELQVDPAVLDKKEIPITAINSDKPACLGGTIDTLLTRGNNYLALTAIATSVSTVDVRGLPRLIQRYILDNIEPFHEGIFKFITDKSLMVDDVFQTTAEAEAAKVARQAMSDFKQTLSEEQRFFKFIFADACFKSNDAIKKNEDFKTEAKNMLEIFLREISYEDTYYPNAEFICEILQHCERYKTIEKTKKRAAELERASIEEKKLAAEVALKEAKEKLATLKATQAVVNKATQGNSEHQRFVYRIKLKALSQQLPEVINAFNILVLYNKLSIQMRPNDVENFTKQFTFIDKAFQTLERELEQLVVTAQGAIPSTSASSQFNKIRGILDVLNNGVPAVAHLWQKTTFENDTIKRLQDLQNNVTTLESEVGSLSAMLNSSEQNKDTVTDFQLNSLDTQSILQNLFPASTLNRLAQMRAKLACMRVLFNELKQPSQLNSGNKYSYLVTNPALNLKVIEQAIANTQFSQPQLNDRLKVHEFLKLFFILMTNVDLDKQLAVSTIELFALNEVVQHLKLNPSEYLQGAYFGMIKQLLPRLGHLYKVMHVIDELGIQFAKLALQQTNQQKFSLDTLRLGYQQLIKSDMLKKSAKKFQKQALGTIDGINLFLRDINQWGKNKCYFLSCEFFRDMIPPVYQYFNYNIPNIPPSIETTVDIDYATLPGRFLAWLQLSFFVIYEQIPDTPQVLEELVWYTNLFADPLHAAFYRQYALLFFFNTLHSLNSILDIKLKINNNFFKAQRMLSPNIAYLKTILNALGEKCNEPNLYQHYVEEVIGLLIKLYGRQLPKLHLDIVTAYCIVLPLDVWCHLFFSLLKKDKGWSYALASFSGEQIKQLKTLVEQQSANLAESNSELLDKFKLICPRYPDTFESTVFTQAEVDRLCKLLDADNRSDLIQQILNEKNKDFYPILAHLKGFYLQVSTSISESEMRNSLYGQVERINNPKIVSLTAVNTLVACYGQSTQVYLSKIPHVLSQFSDEDVKQLQDLLQDHGKSLTDEKEELLKKELLNKIKQIITTNDDHGQASFTQVEVAVLKKILNENLKNKLAPLDTLFDMAADYHVKLINTIESIYNELKANIYVDLAKNEVQQTKLVNFFTDLFVWIIVKNMQLTFFRQEDYQQIRNLVQIYLIDIAISRNEPDNLFFLNRGYALSKFSEEEFKDLQQVLQDAKKSDSSDFAKFFDSIIEIKVLEDNYRQICFSKTEIFWLKKFLSKNKRDDLAEKLFDASVTADTAITCLAWHMLLLLYYVSCFPNMFASGLLRIMSKQAADQLIDQYANIDGFYLYRLSTDTLRLGMYRQDFYGKKRRLYHWGSERIFNYQLHVPILPPCVEFNPKLHVSDFETLFKQSCSLLGKSLDIGNYALTYLVNPYSILKAMGSDETVFTTPIKYTLNISDIFDNTKLPAGVNHNHYYKESPKTAFNDKGAFRSMPNLHNQVKQQLTTQVGEINTKVVRRNQTFSMFTPSTEIVVDDFQQIGSQNNEENKLQPTTGIDRKYSFFNQNLTNKATDESTNVDDLPKLPKG